MIEVVWSVNIMMQSIMVCLGTLLHIYL